MANKDLTVGSPEKALVGFSLPLMGSIVFQQLYNVADSFVAGKFIGDKALAAVGNAYEITLIYLAVAFGCNVGCSIVISQLFGAKRYKDLKTAVSTTFISSAVICAVLTVVGFLFSPRLLHVINTPKEVVGDSLLYLNIYTGGLIFLFFYNISNGIFSALGDSKTPFYFLAVSSSANIFMDIWFVAGFKMGISGVAWATFICQGVSCVLAFIAVLRRLRGFKEKAPLFSFAILKRVMRIAVPSMLQQSFVSVGNILIQSVVNSFGLAVMAGYSAAVKLNTFAITTYSTLGNAVSNFSAQNLGAGKIDRVKKGYVSGLALSIGISLFFTAAFIIFRYRLVGLFMSGSGSEALHIGARFLMIVVPFYSIVCVKITTDSVLRGGGVMGQFMFSTFFDLFLRVALAFVLSKEFLSDGIWFAWPVGWILGAVASVIFYAGGKWKSGGADIADVE